MFLFDLNEAIGFDTDGIEEIAQVVEGGVDASPARHMRSAIQQRGEVARMVRCNEIGEEMVFVVGQDEIPRRTLWRKMYESWVGHALTQYERPDSGRRHAV